MKEFDKFMFIDFIKAFSNFILTGKAEMFSSGVELSLPSMKAIKMLFRILLRAYFEGHMPLIPTGCVRTAKRKIVEMFVNKKLSLLK